MYVNSLFHKLNMYKKCCEKERVFTGKNFNFLELSYSIITINNVGTEVPTI